MFFYNISSCLLFPPNHHHLAFSGPPASFLGPSLLALRGLSPGEERRQGSGGLSSTSEALSTDQTRLTWPQASTCGASVTGKDGSVALARVLWAKGKTKQLAQFLAFEHFLWG